MYFGPPKVIILDPSLHLGVIENDDNTSSFFVDCNNAEAHFIHSVVDNVTVNDILDPVYVPHIVNFLFPLNGVLNHEGVSKPLLAVQVTELIDGSFVGCTMNHIIGDGSSFWQFFNFWSETSRGFDNISRPSVLNRWFPSNTNCPIRIPFCSNEDDEFLANATLYTSSSPQFNVYGNDLGWGKPLAVRSGLANKRDGKITVFPGMKEGSVDIEVCLLPEKFLAMENDKEFMQSIGI
ncbi:uncharacterized acetyltransferase At3g50280-like [Camellia sinensis]|uniref:uncharacterized acetyltransferase At3g50280-like n=1 Tax=Camellia sinensis TaxID=4442 RepID=UPI0010357DB1|nr:uncharacterized acetyltransferase At3g50280-like [Camellia sinensis]